MYLGEYFFDNAKLDSALNAYRSVMKFPESDWFDEALYKLAWTQYRLSNPEKAISSFLALVDLGKNERSGKALLEKESLDYIAISFSESDLVGDNGLTRAISFCTKLNDPEKATQILHRLGNVYEDQGRFDVARKSYAKLLSMYPQYKRNPEVENRLIHVETRDQSLEKANLAKIHFFKKYNRKSKWAKQQKENSTIIRADSIASSMLYDAALSYHQLALQQNDSSEYNKAMDAYRDFIHFYPTAPQANECHYNLAEILFSSGMYFEAAEEYMAVSKRYPDSKYKETAAWNAIVASQNLMKLEGKKE
jgi:TolA-binding protein